MTTRTRKATTDVPELEGTVWWCERCHASGLLEYERSAGVYEVIEALNEAHDCHGLAGLTGCTFSVGRVRVARDVEFKRMTHDADLGTKKASVQP